MNWQGERLVKVRSESELRPGMTVVTRSCRHCGRTCAMLLVRPDEFDECTYQEEPHSGWKVLGNCDARTDSACLIHYALIEGRLYRLRDEPAARQKAATKRREAVR